MADVDHLSRFEAEMERLKTEREKAVQHAEDLGYQVEVLRAKLHEARRSLATRPAYEGGDLGYQAEQLLRNAQIQADQLRADAEREMSQARAQTQRILQEHAEQAARLQAELHQEAVTRRQQLDQELGERRRPSSRMSTRTWRGRSSCAPAPSSRPGGSWRSRAPRPTSPLPPPVRRPSGSPPRPASG